MALKTSLEKAQMYSDAIDDLLTGRIVSYSIGDKSVTKNNIEVLEKIYRYYLAESQKEGDGSNYMANFSQLDSRF